MLTLVTETFCSRVTFQWLDMKRNGNIRGCLLYQDEIVRDSDDCCLNYDMSDFHFHWLLWRSACFCVWNDSRVQRRSWVEWSPSALFFAKVKVGQNAFTIYFPSQTPKPGRGFQSLSFMDHYFHKFNRIPVASFQVERNLFEQYLEYSQTDAVVMHQSSLLQAHE